MPLLKLHRINKGGEIVINSDHIVFAEIESKTTTIHLLGNLLFSVEEPLDHLCSAIENLEVSRLKAASNESKSG